MTDDIYSLPLTDEEVALLPEPLRTQREAHIRYLREQATTHPIEDDGTSITAFAHDVVMRTVVDAVKRKIVLEREVPHEDHTHNPT